MPRKASSSLNLNAFVKDIIESTGIATVKNIDQVLKRIDKMEAKISKVKVVPVKETGRTRARKGPKANTTDAVLAVIQKSKKGADTKTIQEKTDLSMVSVRNALYLLTKAGKIKRVGRGVYATEAVKEQPTKKEKPASASRPAKKSKAKPKTQKKKAAAKKTKPVKKTKTVKKSKPVKKVTVSVAGQKPAPIKTDSAADTNS